LLLISIDRRWRHRLGSLEPGKLANFCVLTEGPRQVDPDTIAEVAVRET
jgi:predicted amidohydrolase YtcJ